MARKLEREPPLSERSSLPRSPVRDDHGDSATRLQCGRHSSQLLAWVDHVLQRMAKHDSVQRPGDRVGRSTASRRRCGLRAERPPARPARTVQCRARSSRRRARRRRGRRGHSRRRATSPVGAGVKRRQREAPVTTSLHLRHRPCEKPARKIERRVGRRVKRAEFGLGHDRQCRSRSARRAPVDPPGAGDPVHPIRRDQRRGHREPTPHARQGVAAKPITRSRFASGRGRPVHRSAHR